MNDRFRQIFEGEKIVFFVLMNKSISYCASRLRCLWARFFLKSMGSSGRILCGIKIRGGKRITIGSGCFIGRNVELDASGGEIVIGNGVEIRDGARILSRGIRMGDKVTVGENAYLSGTLDVEQGAWISRNCDLTGQIKIGRAILGPQVSVIGGEDHARDQTSGAVLMMPDAKNEKILPVQIESGVWIGHGAIILKGVTLSRNLVVGAGSVVTKSFSEGGVIAGNPAQKIRSKLTLDRGT